MPRSRVLSLLAALGLALGVGLVSSVPAGASTQLSSGCALRHSQASQVFGTAGSVFLSPDQYAKGEQLTFVGTTDPGVDLTVKVNFPSEEVQSLHGASGQTIRYTVPYDTGLSFLLTSSPTSYVSWHLDCGIPPAPVITSPSDGQTFAAGESVPTAFTCGEETNPVATCVDSNGDSDGTGTLDTGTLGTHTYSVTATDSTGLTATTSISYTVAKKAQTISFTRTPPNGSDWFFGDFHGSVGYVANAVATSGLPVTYSIDPASGGICRLDGVYHNHPWYGDGVGIDLQAAGTCTIHADQAGDGQYLAAERVTQSFVIEKVPTWMSAAKAVKGVLGLTPSTFSATLAVPYEAGGPGWGLEGYPGQLISFSVAGKQVCTAVTNANGVATCKAAIGLANALSQSSYTATYGGDANYKGATAQGKLG